MKYLKRFSLLESVSIDEIKDLVDSTFANLYDDGFEVDCREDYFSSRFVGPRERFILAKFSRSEAGESFTWNEVKDYYIPFLELVKRRYKLLPFGNSSEHVRIEYVDWHYYPIDSLIEDSTNIRENSKIFSIAIMIEK